jgi:hypothetical protein
VTVPVITLRLPVERLSHNERNILRASVADAYRAETGTDADVAVDLLPVEVA